MVEERFYKPPKEPTVREHPEIPPIEAAAMYVPPEPIIPEVVAPPKIEPTTLEALYPEMFLPEASYGISAEDLPGVILENLRTWAIEEPESFMEDLWGREKPEQARLLLQQFGASEEDIDAILMPAPFEIPPEGYEFEEEVEGIRKLFTIRPDFTVWLEGENIGTYSPETGEFLERELKETSSGFLDAIETGLQYIEGWWKTGLMEAGFGLYKGLELITRRENRWTSEAEKIMDSAYKEHGWKAIFSDEVNEAWDIYFQERVGGKPLAIIAELCNPIWWAGAGGLAGLLVKPFSKIPVLGKTLQGAAKTVQATEEVALLPLTAPLKGGLRFAGKAIGIKPTRPFLVDVLPTATELKSWLFKSDTFRRIAQHIPGMKWVAPGTVISEKLPVTLITKAEVESAVTQEVLQRTAILELGQGTKGQALAYLRELGTTRGILGVKDGICNPKWVKPKFAGESLALGDIVQAPGRYIFRHKMGLEYCKRAQQMCREMYELATKEGVEIHKVGLEPFEEFVHWVCVGKIGKDGVLQMGRRGTRAVGGIVPAMKHRRFENMMDGIKAGYKYSDDLEIYASSYVDDMFKAIGDKRLGDGLAEVIPKVEGMLPTKPLDRLIALYPQREIAWTGIRKEMADLGYAWSAIKRVARGEVLPPATIRALERRTPEYAEKLAIKPRIPEVVPDALPLKQVLEYETRIPLALIKKEERVALKRLASEIKEKGITEPITIRVREDGSLIVWDGIHRLIVAQRLGIKNIPIKFIGDVGKLPITFKPPAVALDKKALRALSKELRLKIKELKPDWWKARFERSEAMQIVRKPILGREEGYIRTVTGYAHPMFQNQIYPKVIADQATKLLNAEAAAFFKVTAGISAAFRMQIAVLDISAWCIQGLMAQFAHPIKAMRANIGMIEALILPSHFQRYLVKIAPSMNERLYYLGAQRPFEFFESMGWFVKMAGKVPGGKVVIGQTFGRAQASFSMWATVYKDLMWQAQGKHWIKAGQGAEFARYLDRMTGMMSFNQLGMPANLSAFLAGWVSFAPQYRLSVLSWFSHLFKGGMIGGEARKDLAKMVAGAMISYTAFCKVTDNPVYLDPYKDGKKFLSINVDEHWIGIGAAVVSMIRAFVDITASALSIDENEPMDFLTLDKWQNPLIRFWFMQSAVLPSMIEEIATRRDFLGYPLESVEDWAMWAGEQVTPIWLQDIFFDESGVPVSFLSVLGNFAGLRTSPQTRWETMNDKMLSLKAWEAVTDLTDEQRERIERGETVLSVLNRFQKAEMFKAFPELIPLYEEALADAMRRGSQIQQNYETATISIQEEAVDGLTKAMDVGVKLDGEDTRWLRDRYGDIMNIYGAKNDILRDVEEYQDMFDEWDEAREKRKPEAELVDLAYWEYIEDVVSPDYELPNGDFDFEAYDNALAEFKAKWGEDIYGKILYVLEHNKAEYPNWAIKLWKDRLELNKGGYWKLPYKLITKMDEDDEAEGNIPDEYLGLWKQYQVLETDVEREAFIKEHPEMAKDWRQEFRLANPEADAMLALWGYGGKLQSMEAYDLVVKWGRELGIPLEQMGLGLPPPRLIDNYFELNKIVAETSGSSIQARLYKLEHPEYLAWGLEQGIWGDDLTGERIDALSLRDANKDLTAEYEALSDIEDEKERRDAQRAWKLKNPKWVNDMRRVEAIENDASDVIVEKWVERGERADEFGGTSSEAILWLIDNPDVYDWAVEKELLEDKREENKAREPILRIDVQYATEDDWYDDGIPDKHKAIENRDARNAAIAKERASYLAGNPEYNKVRYRRDAYGLRDKDFNPFPDKLIDTYVDYYTIPKKPDDWLEGVAYYEDEWFLQAHPEFHQALVDFGVFKELRDFSKVPPRDIFKKWWIYNKLTTQYDRDTYRLEHPDLDEWGVSVEIWTRTMSEKRRRLRITPSERFLEDIAEREREFQEMLESLGLEL